ncbi:Uncharacterised protein [Mycoplasmopsis californica]|uniref:DUF2975 domain-containing protein n=1 Tax=Mycoplasmopsis equigenitalium TaxID=114883 RepID=A0ABY5J0I0_9BACT|nr:hypothetical protein [Mycoplasmopsis equigenitalium]UUD36767.1 hypothetical protein NPA09_02610 [Mycoplasmopsis equigenitalium]VEU69936.1 Uncharacterised protein [Mycoplasmopsis californica]
MKYSWFSKKLCLLISFISFCVFAVLLFINTLHLLLINEDSSFKSIYVAGSGYKMIGGMIFAALPLLLLYIFVKLEINSSFFSNWSKQTLNMKMLSIGLFVLIGVAALYLIAFFLSFFNETNSGDFITVTCFILVTGLAFVVVVLGLLLFGKKERYHDEIVIEEKRSKKK